MSDDTIPETEAEPFGSRLELSSSTSVVFGRKLDLERREADVGNVLLHRCDDTLFVVDSGATPEFRRHLRDAIEAARPFRHLVLVNSHGHCDHVFNNGIVDEVEAETRRHYASLLDFPLMCDNEGYLSRAFKGIAEHVDLPAAPGEMASRLMELYGPRDTRVDQVLPIESLPTHPLELSGTLWEGWSLADDFVVLRQHGHTRGHLAAYVPSARLLFMGDETSTCYGSWPDSTAWASLSGLRKAARMLKGGAVERLVDGHNHTIFDSVRASRLLKSLIHEYQFLDHVVIDTLRKSPRTVDDVESTLRAAGFTDGMDDHPLLSQMQILKKIREIGAVPMGGSGTSTRFGLRTGV